MGVIEDHRRELLILSVADVATVRQLVKKASTATLIDVRDQYIALYGKMNGNEATVGTIIKDRVQAIGTKINEEIQSRGA